LSVSTIWTIGHSTHPIDQFLEPLARLRIEAVGDVRSFPGSRRYPHFGKQALSATLADHGIDYRWLPALGGRRRPRPDSPNSAWRNSSFRGYADHMASAEFAQGIEQLLELAANERCAIMCSESLWWRCHRSLIADALCVRDIKVLHILDADHVRSHPMTAPARIVRGQLRYDADDRS
jgi:uncharacterized protein (DUF488 family)